MSKGGPRRALVAAVDSDMDQLNKCSEDAVDSWGANAFNRGAQCRSLAPECWVCEKTCGHQQWWITIEASHCKVGAIPQQDLKDDLWAGQTASQFICILSNWRRLRRDADKLKQCLRSSTGAQRSTIEELVVLEQLGLARKPPTCHAKAQVLLLWPVRRPMKATQKLRRKGNWKLKSQMCHWTQTATPDLVHPQRSKGPRARAWKKAKSKEGIEDQIWTQGFKSRAWKRARGKGRIKEQICIHQERFERKPPSAAD